MNETKIQKRNMQKRKRILIGDLQYRLLAVNLLYFAVIVVLFAAILFGPLVWQLGSSGLSPAERGQAATQLLSLHARVWPPLLALLVFLAVHSVYVSHRIAGPLFQFRRLLHAVKDGNLTVRASIRDKDYLESEAAVINELIEALSTRIKGIEEHSVEILEGVDKLRRAADRGSRDELGQNIRSLRKQVHQLQLSLSQFKTVPADEVDEALDGVGADEAPATSGAAPSAAVAESSVVSELVVRGGRS